MRRREATGPLAGVALLSMEEAREHGRGDGLHGSLVVEPLSALGVPGPRPL